MKRPSQSSVAPRALTEESLRMIAERFKVLGEPMRLRILHSLFEGEKAVAELIEEVGGLQANVSKHLGMLHRSGLVSRRKDGLRAYYRIRDETVFELCDVVCSSLHDRLSSQIDELPAVARKAS